MRSRIAAGLTVVLAAACSGPTTPPPPPPPPVVGPATPPVIQAITVPTSRVETGADITITATVQDAETPLTQLAYQWTASAGTITGSGTTATWTMPAGIKAGVNVTITLTIVDTYDAVENNQVVNRQFTVVGTSTSFRVHDSVAETKELARRFLIDLFGNSAVQPEACMVDFSDTCAGLPEGKTAELEQVRRHRRDFIVYQATMLAQRVDWDGAGFGYVHNAVLYDDQEIGKPPKSPTCGDFYLTVVYVGGQWWLCESYFDRFNTAHCPASINNEGVSRVLRSPGGGK